MMLFCPEQETGERLSLSLAELGISAGFRQRAHPHSQVLGQQMPGADGHAGEVVSAVPPSVLVLISNLCFPTSCPHGFGLRKMASSYFLFLSFDFSQ